jgi:hypothetical protein
MRGNQCPFNVSRSVRQDAGFAVDGKQTLRSILHDLHMLMAKADFDNVLPIPPTASLWLPLFVGYRTDRNRSLPYYLNHRFPDCDSRKS